MNRRNFLRLGLSAAAVIAAPALVARASIMAIKPAKADTIIGLMLLLEEQFRVEDRDRYMIVREDMRRLLIDVDEGKPGGDHTVIVHRNLEIGQIDRFTIYESPPLVASNYGRGPGLLSEDALGVRSWAPAAPTAREIVAKRAEAWRQMRRWFETNRSKRWV